MRFITAGQWLSVVVFAYTYFILAVPMLYLTFLSILLMFCIADVMIREIKKYIIGAVASTVHLLGTTKPPTGDADE